MENVHTLDIDGFQWSMKDQDAQDRLSVIEQRNTIEFKDIEQDGCYLQMAKRNGIVDCFIKYHPSTDQEKKVIEFIGILPVGWRPAVSTRNQFVTNTNDTYKGQMVVRESGNIDIWSGVGSFTADTDYTTSITFVCAD